MNVVLEWFNDLRGILDDQDQLIQAVQVGVFYTAVEISSGHTGVAVTPRLIEGGGTINSVPSAGFTIGRHAWQLADFAFAESPLCRAIGIATLNALSALALGRASGGGRVHEDLDVLEAARVNATDRVALVGVFNSHINALKDRVVNLCVIDRHRETLRPEDRHRWMPLERAPEVLAQADVVIISAAMLIEGDLDSLLSAACNARRVIIAGPGTPLWGRPFFGHGVHALGGIRIRDSAGLLRLLAEGGSSEFFNRVVDMVTVMADGRRGSDKTT
ncbi:MAG: Rossmann-like domain-containing protein [Candidatus Binataceae bacterium]